MDSWGAKNGYQKYLLCQQHTIEGISSIDSTGLEILTFKVGYSDLWHSANNRPTWNIRLWAIGNPIKTHHGDLKFEI